MSLQLVYIWLCNAFEVGLCVTFQITMFFCSLGEAVLDDCGSVRKIVEELIRSNPPLAHVFVLDL